MLPVLAALVLAAALPASACDQNKTSATAAGAGMGSCSGMSHSTAWAGAWLQRSQDGALTVAAVAEGSPAARSGLKKGDIVLAVNGHDLSSASSGHMCAGGASCAIGSSFAYTVQRGKSTKVVKVQLEKMPAEATARYAAREASFEPMLAAVVIPPID
jgi:S1-C subfamily serine protease